MKVVRYPAERPGGAPGRVVTIGAFDGVHLGHRALVRIVHELAAARGLEAGLVTFDRHPAEVVRPESAPKLLTTLDQKLELLESTGLLDLVLLVTFDEQRREEQAADFVREVLVDALGAKVVVVGADFHFGRNRGGNVPLLQHMGSELGFEVIGLGLVAAPDGGGAAGEEPPYSSTRVRALLAAGDVEEAAVILARPHALQGVVEQGDRRGRDLGFPTANVAVPDRMCAPADGVYAGTFVAADGVERLAALSVGSRPTFYEQGARLLEAYVLDFEGDLYGQAVEVRFHARIRNQEVFDSEEALSIRMRGDVEAVRALVGGSIGSL